MKSVFLATAFCLATTGMASALTPTPDMGRTVACFDKVWIAPTYTVTKELVQPKKRVYVKRRGLIELVEYAAIYREIKTLKEDGHWVLRQIACKKK
ncbi:hypothetical protein [Anianabacter salinae]|uniref:hypothetical protein n=1 Tax=Anianabacter salinae TaxID=2851023 RepID=UPI00225E31E6|nr:hypothetical protein [Anianabacter salinae]MBV0912103.1 hypothetical protein [Anianabacter salinae]